MKKALFPHFLRSLMITYLTTLNLEKEILILEKSLEKVLTFGSKNLYEPWNNGNMCIARLEPPLTPPKNWLVILCLVYSNKNDLILIWKMLLVVWMEFWKMAFDSPSVQDIFDFGFWWFVVASSWILLTRDTHARDITLHEKLDLYKLTWCKHGAKKCKLGENQKMVNAAIACQFTRGCKFEGKCSIYQLCPLFSLSLHFFAPNLHWVILV